jgi:lipoate-protein ligase A
LILIAGDDPEKGDFPGFLHIAAWLYKFIMDESPTRKTQKKEWGLIIERSPLPGSLNMAIDEYLFLSLAKIPQTCVRFYQWERPTISLGYSQPLGKTVDLDFCRRNGIDVVRRITGGKLVLHWNEITYSIASSDAEAFSPTLAGSYRLISEALMKGLERMGLKARLAGPPPSSYSRRNAICFSHPARDEIEVGGKKLIGSAQKRVGTRFLQHGSIPLSKEEGLLREAALADKEGVEIRMTSLSEALGRPVRFEDVAENLAAGLAGFFGVALRPMSFRPDEYTRILRLQRRKYENEAWTRGGKSPSLDFSDSG